MRRVGGITVRVAQMVLIAALALVCWSCRPSARDLTVTNRWDMPITVQWSPDRDTPLDERVRLGAVNPGQTILFRAALPIDGLVMYYTPATTATNSSS